MKFIIASLEKLASLKLPLMSNRMSKMSKYCHEHVVILSQFRYTLNDLKSVFSIILCTFLT